jgi:glycosyltransferase involved in cell wall biosynthesis
MDVSENCFIVLFAGNIGEAQNLDFVIDVIAELKNDRMKFVFVGSGRKKEYLEGRVKRLGLSESVFFLGQYPIDAMPAFMQMADVLLVSLKDEIIFGLTIPSKVQFYMAQGKPILAILNGDGADLINKAKCGLTVPADNRILLKDAIRKLYLIPKEELNTMGQNGKRYYEQTFIKEKRMDQLDKLFKTFCIEESWLG